MAVIAVWQCDRDGSMFDDKKQAEEHDKYLELAANITQLIEAEVHGISEAHSEAVGLLLARRRDTLVKACKGKPELLLEVFEETTQQKGEKPQADQGTVTAFAANQ